MERWLQTLAPKDLPHLQPQGHWTAGVFTAGRQDPPNRKLNGIESVDVRYFKQTKANYIVGPC